MNLPYARHEMTDEDIAAVVDALRWDDLSGGDYIRRFEEALEERVGGRVVAVSSGTAALHLALVASGVRPGDAVAVPALTFIATANVVKMVGGVPVFVDVDPGTWTIDPQAVRYTRPHFDAVIGVDFAGLPVWYDELRKAAGQGVAIIADACHSLGSKTEGDWKADYICYSFHPAKHITSGEGGAVVLPFADAAGYDSDYNLLRALRNHGIDTQPDGSPLPTLDRSYSRLGWNYRMTTLGAALAWSQLRRLDANITRRTELVAMYEERLSDTFLGMKFQYRPPGMKSAHHILPVLLPQGANRRRIFDAMREAGIGVQVHYRPVHLEPLYGGEANRGMCPVAEGLYERLLTLPLFPAMREQDVVMVVEELRKAVMGL